MDDYEELGHAGFAGDDPSASVTDDVTTADRPAEAAEKDPETPGSAAEEAEKANGEAAKAPSEASVETAQETVSQAAHNAGGQTSVNTAEQSAGFTGTAEGEYHYTRSQQYREPQPGSGPSAEQPGQKEPFGAGQAQQGAPRQERPYGAAANDGYANPSYANRPYTNAGAPNTGAPNGYYYGNQAPGGAYRQGYDPRAGFTDGTAPDPAQQQYAYTQTAKPEEKRKKNGGRRAFITVIVILLALVVGGIVGMIIKGNDHDLPEEKIPAVTEEDETLRDVEEVVPREAPGEVGETPIASAGVLTGAQVYKKVYETSVGIQVYDSRNNLVSEGSGVILQEDNAGELTYIVTCAHVITGGRYTIMVQLSDETEYPAEIVGYDSRTDIGVLSIKEKGLKKAEVGNSDSLVVGDMVYAIGNPGGSEFAGSFTNGIISAIDRPVSSSSSGYTMECLQHNAAINPGNSGGGLFNEYGQLVGINSMKIVADEYEGMGFAVPSSVFTDVVNEILANGYVSSRAKLGITYIKASSQQAYAMFVAIKDLPAGSIIVAGISDDSDFADSGLQKGDLITAINGKDLDSASDLAATIENLKIGDKVTLSVLRINDDYSYKEYTFTGVLVPDKADASVYGEEEETTERSLYDEFGGNSGGSGGYGGYGGSGGSDYFNDFFNDFFDRYFGGSNP